MRAQTQVHWLAKQLAESIGHQIGALAGWVDVDSFEVVTSNCAVLLVSIQLCCLLLFFYVCLVSHFELMALLMHQPCVDYWITVEKQKWCPLLRGLLICSGCKSNNNEME